MQCDKLINQAFFRSKLIKDQLIENNKNIEKLANTEKNFFSYSLFQFALTEGILENVTLLNINKSTVKKLQ